MNLSEKLAGDDVSWLRPIQVSRWCEEILHNHHFSDFIIPRYLRLWDHHAVSLQSPGDETLDILKAMDAVPKLTCARCKRRKVKCDKRTPCSACVQAGALCETVRRARLPRGRSGNVKKATLEKRLSKLEAMLTQVQEPKTIALLGWI